MTKITNKFAFLLCLLAISTFTWAASEAEFGKMSKAWTLHADGSQEFRCNKELTLFTHTAMNGTYGESFIVYNPDFQELKINASYTKQKDGTIVKTPDNAFVEVLPRAAADAPAYNQLKEMVVVHTGLELGATIYLDYTILTKPGYYAELDINENLQETSPVKECNLTISVPENKPLVWDLYGSNTKASEATKNGAKVVNWTLRNVPASSHEAFLPENGTNIPRLMASTYASQKDALAAMNKRFNDSQSYECKTFAQYITEKAANEKEKVDIIQKHVVNNMGNCGVSLSNTGFTVRDADVVLRSAYGTVAEKTQLLNTLLNAAGVKSEVVAIYPALFKGEACGLNTIKGMAVKTTVNGEDAYLSATTLATPDICHRGELDNIYTLTGNKVAVSAKPLTVTEAKSATAKASDAVNGHVICTLPTSTEGVNGWHLSPLNSRRTQLLEIPSMIKQELTYTVTPDEGLKLTSPTASDNLENKCGKVTRSISQDGNKVIVKQTIELNKLQYTPTEYNDLRSLINKWSNPNNSILLFSAK